MYKQIVDIVSKHVTCFQIKSAEMLMMQHAMKAVENKKGTGLGTKHCLIKRKQQTNKVLNFKSHPVLTLYMVQAAKVTRPDLTMPCQT